MAPGRAAHFVVVRIDASVWAEEVERFASTASGRAAAERERQRLEQVGISRSLLLRCDAAGSDGTRLGGLLKSYVPINDGPPSAGRSVSYSPRR